MEYWDFIEAINHPAILIISLYLIIHLLGPLDWYLFYKLYKKIRGVE